VLGTAFLSFARLEARPDRRLSSLCRCGRIRRIDGYRRCSEAGREDKNRWIHIPLGFGKTFADPTVNWCYETEPDPGASGRRVFWPRGKVLGGSSSINGMVYIRGQAEDFNHWRQLGNSGWSFDDVLPYFRHSEHQVRGASEFHGTGGPLCVSDVAQHLICEAFIAASTQLGFPRNVEQQNPRRRVLAQPCCDRAPRRARADYDEIGLDLFLLRRHLSSPTLRGQNNPASWAQEVAATRAVVPGEASLSGFLMASAWNWVKG
jgi:GMC oxidoreductase